MKIRTALIIPALETLLGLMSIFVAGAWVFEVRLFLIISILYTVKAAHDLVLTWRQP